jgi:hypothetical protein
MALWNVHAALESATAMEGVEPEKGVAATDRGDRHRKVKQPGEVCLATERGGRC